VAAGDRREESREISSADTLAGLLRPHRDGIISIDGQHGVGKTTLARELTRLLGMRVVHLDDFLSRGRGGFVAFLDLEAIATALASRSVLVDGVCMLDVLERLGLRADATVYVRETSPHTRGKLDAGALAAEVADYQRRRSPEQVASFVFVRPMRAREGTVCAVESQEAQVDIAFINAKTKLAITLAVGGMLTLVVGLVVLLYGVQQAGDATVKLAGMEVAASGMGAVIMVTSSVWAFFAYKSRPIYVRRRDLSETYDSGSRLLSRTERTSATEARSSTTSS